MGKERIVWCEVTRQGSSSYLRDVISSQGFKFPRRFHLCLRFASHTQNWGGAFDSAKNHKRQRR